MEKESIKINNIPAILWGKQSDKVYLYVHGQGGSKEDAECFAKVAVENQWQVISIDLPGHGERKDEAERFDPWHVTLFLSPVLDMYRLISNMIQWAGTTEECLEKERVIPTDFGQTLYWDYYQYAKNNAIKEWRHKTGILYGSADTLIEYETVKEFSEHLLDK